jgi:hypothetical protein
MSLHADGSSGTVAFVDADVLRDVADALDGRWLPDEDTDPIRRASLLAAARLRLYGEPDRSGWRLVSTTAALERAAMRGDTDWSLSAIVPIESFDDAPNQQDVNGLVKLYRGENIGPEEAIALAHAVLWEPVRYLVTIDKRPYRHSRDDDLRAELELITVGDAVELLEIAPGEAPLHDAPSDSALARQKPWWIPR